MCEECKSLINCSKENIYIVTKDELKLLWCKDCFTDLWKTAYDYGWRGDDIDYQIELDEYCNI